ncbi:MAG TPA: hypothetical protein VF271_00380 [Rhodanobacteraceae bacterium]
MSVFSMHLAARDFDIANGHATRRQVPGPTFGANGRLNAHRAF